MIAGWLFSLAYRCLFGWLSLRIAQGRGYETGFAWGFWLGLIGLIVVARRPVREAKPVSSKPETRWMCLSCGARNPAGVGRCQSCQRPRAEKTPKWVCTSCQASNNAGNARCFACGKEH